MNDQIQDEMVIMEEEDFSKFCSILKELRSLKDENMKIKSALGVNKFFTLEEILTHIKNLRYKSLPISAKICYHILISIEEIIENWAIDGRRKPFNFFYKYKWSPLTLIYKFCWNHYENEFNRFFIIKLER
jgi:hypothetical protein